MMVLIATSGLMISCKDDEMESITLKRSGNLKVTIKNGESPVADTQIRFFNANTGNELDVVATNAQGVIDFGKLNEGNYGISFEVSEPYSLIEQEFQVVSGENKEYTVQVKDYVGNLTVFLKDNYNGSLIMEDLKVGVAIVPDNNDFAKAFSNGEIIALATEMSYFGTKGSILFENIPTGEYTLYQIVGDSIIARKHEIQVNRASEEITSIIVNPGYEKLFNKEIWIAAGALNYSSGDPMPSFPLESIVFFRDSKNAISYKMTLSDGLIENGGLYHESYNNFNEFYLQNGASNNQDISVSWSSSEFYIDENGQITLRFYSFNVYDEINNSYVFSESNIEVTLK